MDQHRFMGFVKQQDDGCWIWIGGTTKKGYGKCGHNYKTVSAHVMSFRLFKGPVPAGLIVLHKCNVKLCVNPEHLKAGTYKENSADSLANNGWVGQLPTISPEVIFKILKLRHNLVPCKMIAEEVGLSVDYITGVLSGNVQPRLKTEYEAEFGAIPKFHAGHKMSDEDRIEIVKLYNSGKVKPTEIAKQFNTTYKYVWKLAHKSIHA